MFKLLSDKKLFFLCILIINTILFYLLSHSSIRTRPFGDNDFHEETKVISQFIWGNETFEKISVTKAPGPVIYYLIPYFLTGPLPTEENYWLFATIWNCIGSALALLLLSIAGEKLTANSLTRIITIISAFIIPLHVYYGTSVTGEVPAFIGMALMMYAFSIIFTEKATVINKTIITIMGAGAALLILCRPNTSLLIVLMIPFLLVLRRKRSSLFKPLAYGMTFALITVIFVSSIVKQLPNTRKTYRQIDYLAYVILQGSFQFRDEPNDWRFFDPSVRPDSRDMINYLNTQKLLYQKMNAENKTLSEVNFAYIINEVINHPIIFLRQCVTKTLYGHSLNVSSVKHENFSLGPLSGLKGYYLFYYCINIFNVVLIILSIYTLYEYYRWQKILVVLIPWISLLVFHATTYMEYRYMFPIRAIILIFSAIGVVNLIRKKAPSFFYLFNIS